MKEYVSVCIPTCDRPQYFEAALQSVLEQSLKPYEVLIGDDSVDNETKAVVMEYEDEGRIRYLDNDPPLGQAKNVDRLFQAAEGDYIVLLHDDDLLVEGALDTLSSCFDENTGIVAAFGKQQVVDAGGNVKTETTRSVNEGYFRTSEFEGVQDAGLRSAITQQFPNDGYMVRAKAAKQVGYARSNVGDACDFAFGVELARQMGKTFYYVDEFTSQYRQSEQSIVRGEEVDDTAFRALRYVLRNVSREVREDPHVQRWLRERAPVAVMQAAQNGYPKQGLKWYFSPYHQHRILTMGGIHRLLRLIGSFFMREQ
jgi:glycosyltransferase involved in cell wall biosynthesis